MKLRSGTLVVGSNVLQGSPCRAGGYSWLNYLDYKSGLAVTGSQGLNVSQQVSNSLIVGLTVIQLRDGSIRAVLMLNGGTVTKDVPKSGVTPSVKRTSWREVPG